MGRADFKSTYTANVASRIGEHQSEEHLKLDSMLASCCLVFTANRLTIDITMLPSAILESMRQKNFCRIEKLLLIDNIMAVHSLEDLGEIFTKSFDNVLDLFRVEFCSVKNRSIRVIGSKNTVGTKVSNTIVVLEQRRNPKRIGLGDIVLGGNSQMWYCRKRMRWEDLPQALQ